MTARRSTVAPLLALMALALAVPAVAQPTRSARVRSPAFDEGYARGVDAGRDDARRNRPYSYIDDLAYRSADAGYRSEYGPRDWYRDEFRRGYAAGYAEGYPGGGQPYRSSDGYRGTYGYPGTPPGWNNGRGNSGRRGGAPPPWYGSGSNYGRGQRVDLALENGYLDGYEAGLDDGADRRRFNPVGEQRYRSADHGYDRRYGPIEFYRNGYRDAFRQGYEAGYDDGRRYGNGRPWWWPWS